MNSASLKRVNDIGITPYLRGVIVSRHIKVHIYIKIIYQ